MIRAYHQPKGIDDALALLKSGAQAVAGATGLYSNRKKIDRELVDITGLGLDSIEVKANEIHLGATVTLTKLLEADIPGAEGKFLKHVARHITAHTMRNVITIGGNIAHAVFWADMPVAFLAMDARVVVARAGEDEKVFSMTDALKAPAPWADGGLITKIIIPIVHGRTFGYERLSRTKNDYAYATAAASMSLKNGAAHDVRVVLGAIQPKAFRSAELEAAVEGKAVDCGLLENLASLAKALPVAPNFRASADYRREVTCALVKRAVAQAAGKEE